MAGVGLGCVLASMGLVWVGVGLGRVLGLAQGVGQGQVWCGVWGSRAGWYRLHRGLGAAGEDCAWRIAGGGQKKIEQVLGCLVMRSLKWGLKVLWWALN